MFVRMIEVVGHKHAIKPLLHKRARVAREHHISVFDTSGVRAQKHINRSFRGLPDRGYQNRHGRSSVR
jgi:hypothetical protein